MSIKTFIPELSASNPIAAILNDSGQVEELLTAGPGYFARLERIKSDLEALTDASRETRQKLEAEKQMLETIINWINLNG